MEETGALSTLRGRLKPLLWDFAWTLTWLFSSSMLCLPFSLTGFSQEHFPNNSLHRTPCLRIDFWGSWPKISLTLPFKAFLFDYKNICLIEFWVNFEISDWISASSEFLPLELFSLHYKFWSSSPGGDDVFTVSWRIVPVWSQLSESVRVTYYLTTHLSVSMFVLITMVKA